MNEITSTHNLRSGASNFEAGGLKVKGTDYCAEIGNYCSIGNNCTIILENHDYEFGALQGRIYNRILNEKHPGIGRKSNSRSRGPITIGSDVWIGDNVTILSGVHIGSGSIIGAGSIVTRCVPYYSIWAGNPASCRGLRFTKQVADKFMEIEWWNWTEDKILENKEMFMVNHKENPEFMETYEIKEC